MARYNGFSTVGQTKKFRLTDFELVKRDLINNFNIKKGEKLMNPNFGTIIWDMIFEPLDDTSKNSVIQDVQRIIANEPRVAAENVAVTTYDRGIQIEISLIYVDTDQRDMLTLDFNGNATKVNVL